MKILIKRYDNTKVQYDWIELNTDKQHFNSLDETKDKVLNTGNSGIMSHWNNHDMVVEVKTVKEFQKQVNDMIRYARNMFE